MTASVDVITDRRSNVITVPIAAVTTRSNKVENSQAPTQADESE